MPIPSRSVDRSRKKGGRGVPTALDNGRIASLLAHEGANARGHLALALKRASRSALLWPDEAADLMATGRPLTELQGIGPNLAQLIAGWMKSPPSEPPNPESLEFLTMSRAKRVLAENPRWSGKLNGDLHMHTDWSDGSATVYEMARAACEHGYAYIGITDHTKGLRIVRGLDESRLNAQGQEIRVVNRVSEKRRPPFGSNSIRRSESLRRWRGRYRPGRSRSPRCRARIVSFCVAKT